MKSFLLLPALSAAAVLPHIAAAADWPQWRGPNRDDISNETDLLERWPKDGPKQLWVTDKAGLGYSGPAIVDGVLYTLGVDDVIERLKAFDTESGELKWQTDIGTRYTNNWGDGPRSTPSVVDGKVYALGAKGDLVCVNAADGSEVWSVSLTDDLGGDVPGWGYTESPLVENGRVYCTPGGDKGAIAALDAATGKVVWQSENFDDGAQYASIVPADHNGVRQLIQLTMDHIVGVNAADGSVLWTSDWPGKTAVIPTPIFHDGHVYVSSGYGVGCKLMKIGPENKVEEVYQNKVMTNHHGGVVLVDGYLYGYSDGNGWTCQNFKSGEEEWSNNEDLKKGAIHCANNQLYLLNEGDGTVVLIDASPRRWNERGRFKLEPQSDQRKQSGRIWTHPVVSDGKLYLRDQEFLHCYDVAK